MEPLRIIPDRPAADAYDELVTGQRGIRRHWQAFISTMRALPGDGMRERAERARRLFADAGVSFRGAPAAIGRAARWPFDPIPLILPSDEWRAIERGIDQRARLLSAVMADIYGPQRMLKERLLPPAIVQANAQFLRPCRRQDGAAARQPLTVYAADLVRGPDGAWNVLADYADSPVGAGYALLNRRTLARVMPEAFRAVAVRQIGTFFDHWAAHLHGLTDAAQPAVALLTPGPLSASYYEHAYLGRALGLTLVEGGDLTVRDQGVAIKTIAGLRNVDVLMRRIASEFCDPLELRGDSMLGVTGLVEATRSGKIALANALGAGVIESPALPPFLPGLCQAVLGEKLAMAALDTWWMGEPQAMAEALAKIDRLTLRRCSAGPARAVALANLQGAERETLLGQLRAAPYDWVAQYPTRPSLAPVLAEQALDPQRVVLRVFALLGNGHDVTMMPGGIAWVPNADPLNELGRLGRLTKDVWVLADDPVDVAIPSSDRFQRLHIARGVDIQSRVADNLYWLGRNTERLDNAARLLRAALMRLSIGPIGGRDLFELACLAHALAHADLIDRQSALAPPDSSALNLTLTRFGDADQPFAEILHRIGHLADAVRDRISSDMSTAIERMIAGFDDSWREAAGDPDRLIAVLDEAIRFVASFAGLSQENVTRGNGWRFMDLGRRIERAIFICRGALAAFERSPIAWDPSMALALELCDSTLTYRGRYLASLQPAAVLDLVLLDESNPRALAFQLHAIETQLHGLARGTGTTLAFDPLPALGWMRDAVKLFEADERSWRHEGLALAELRHALDRTAQLLTEGSDVITRSFFSLVPVGRQLGGPGE